MRVYTNKLTSDSVVTYLFHDRECSLWLFCLVWHVRVMIKLQYTWTDSYGGYQFCACVCAMFEGLTEFCFVFRFGFRASLLDFTSRIELLYVRYYCADCMKCFSVFCSDIVAHVHRLAGQVRSDHRQHAYVAVFMTRVTDQLFALNRGWLLQRLLGLGICRTPCSGA